MKTKFSLFLTLAFVCGLPAAFAMEQNQELETLISEEVGSYEQAIIAEVVPTAPTVEAQKEGLGKNRIAAEIPNAEELEKNGLPLAQALQIQRRRVQLFPENFLAAERQLDADDAKLNCRQASLKHVPSQGVSVIGIIIKALRARAGQASSEGIAKLRDLATKCGLDTELFTDINEINRAIPKLTLVDNATQKCNNLPKFAECANYRVDSSAIETFFAEYCPALEAALKMVVEAGVSQKMQVIISRIEETEAAKDEKLIALFDVCKHEMRSYREIECNTSACLHEVQTYLDFENDCQAIREFFAQKQFHNSDLVAAILMDRLSKVSLNDWLNDILENGVTFSEAMGINLSKSVLAALSTLPEPNTVKACRVRHIAELLFELAEPENTKERDFIVDFLGRSLNFLNDMTRASLNSDNKQYDTQVINESYRATFLVYQYFLTIFERDSDLKTIVRNRELAKNGITLAGAYRQLFGSMWNAVVVDGPSKTLANVALKGSTVSETFFNTCDFAATIAKWIQNNPIEAETILVELINLQAIFGGTSSSYLGQCLSAVKNTWRLSAARKLLNSVLGQSANIVDSDSIMAPEMIALVHLLPKISTAAQTVQGIQGNNLAGNAVGTVVGMFAPRWVAIPLAGAAGALQNAITLKLAKSMPNQASSLSIVGGLIKGIESRDPRAALRYAANHYLVQKAGEMIGMIGWKNLALGATFLVTGQNETTQCIIVLVSYQVHQPLKKQYADKLDSVPNNFATFL